MQKPKSEDKCRKLCGKNMEVLEVEPTKIPVWPLLRLWYAQKHSLYLQYFVFVLTQHWVKDPAICAYQFNINHHCNN